MSSLFLACKNKSNLATDKNLVLTDTSLLRRSGFLSDSAKAVVPVGTTTSSTTTTVTTTTTTGPKVITPKRKVYASPAPRRSRSTANTNNSSTANSSTTATAPVKKDAKFSDAAKGTAIGVGSGAIIGAVVGKNVKGAVIGGVIGGGAGYAIGRARDVKSGRVARKKAQQ
ncbi:MAG: hypothetical protein JWP81_4559 [Ferruginibacter sp.]|nr:hypothetical protein [Ferruginibacter sp.]